MKRLVGALLALFGCAGKPTVAPYCAPAAYGALDRTVRFADLVIEFLGTSRAQSGPRPILIYSFRVAAGSEEKVVTWSAGMGDIGPSRFELGGRSYTLERTFSDHVKGRLADNELVVCPVDPKR